jgi:MFS superfamily sulfate permease-like transporter
MSRACHIPTDTPVAVDPPRRGTWVRFDRNEFAGSFGDIGTDLPLIIGIILAAGLDSASVFIVFGLMQIATGVLYGLPMPMQPLKAMAVLVITQQIDGAILYGAGIAIGAIMLLLTFTGLLTWLTRVIPLCVVRGLQLGLGLSLASLAITRYVPAMGTSGYILAGLSFIIIVALWGNRRIPAALIVIMLGALYAIVFRIDMAGIAQGVGFSLPTLHTPTWSNIGVGMLLLAMPQLPLSLSNAVVATHQTLRDLYPHRHVRVNQIGGTYGVVNLISPWFGGIPLCHGCGGLAGHHAFGARTGGSVIIYGCLYLVIGLFFSRVFGQVVEVFPLPVLGVVLLFEAVVLMALARDVARGPAHEWMIALLAGLVAWTMPHGYMIAALLGCAVFYIHRIRSRTRTAALQQNVDT